MWLESNLVFFFVENSSFYCILKLSFEEPVPMRGTWSSAGVGAVSTFSAWEEQLAAFLFHHDRIFERKHIYIRIVNDPSSETQRLEFPPADAGLQTGLASVPISPRQAMSKRFRKSGSVPQKITKKTAGFRLRHRVDLRSTDGDHQNPQLEPVKPLPIRPNIRSERARSLSACRRSCSSLSASEE
mmetsp:Transcript_3315/g.15673  ORF Transcript_3315/g.15673 Transcript_3315/m.15673 type:complete len:185 (-) Transcript_3315:1140-1694(-)